MKIVRIILGIAIVYSLLFFTNISSTHVAALTNKDAACQAITGNSSCNDNSGGVDVNKALKVGLNIFTSVVGIVAVIMIVLAGYKYMTSSGDSNKIANAKQTLIYALVGLVIAALAQVIVQYVIGRAA